MSTPVATFGARLTEAVDRFGPLCPGIDPHASLLSDWGLSDDVDGLRRFADVCLEAYAGRVAVVKPQSAFFERHGSRGVAVLEDVLAALRGSGTLSLLDVKRGDIGSTMGAYADAYLSEASPLRADAVTVSPYLGFGSLAPAVDLARETGRGLFVLAMTSNPEGASVQHAVRDGVTVAQTVIDGVTALNAAESTRLASFGLVTGATIGKDLADLGLTDALATSRAPLLAPGLGAQGATIEDVRRGFGAAESQVLPAVSRGLLAAGPDPLALRAATDRATQEAAALRP
ncbi:orotidine-5'-phosphate decarboxylase [Luteipulveratus sp. YIM 133132]|uniref:orotidine-5'-phosphate decarboxylase n=1 Tax=Luteipulveratus flavus TaxID=3031728 RepID=UPI0023AF65EA|nr:orotidine-5'-phosphate decarboxylase [Luteipulveratus sp. YIM 133132]MDE9366051.1 orotidine-5'-phosphate decarboxylase [Luteipulveratus sp. YIM 133132]